MDKDILDTLNVSSYSHRILAAYQARELAYDICKSQYGKPNYKDYVEMLMRRDCPKEWEKAEVGRKYRNATQCLIWMPYFFYFHCSNYDDFEREAQDVNKIDKNHFNNNYLWVKI
jgi:hypothetical protein